MTDILNLPHAIAADDGTFVNSEHERLARIIQDYDEEMELAWIPPAHRNDATPPYAILHRPRDRNPYVIFTITEMDMQNPQAILARLFAGDLSRNPNVLRAIEANEAAAQALEMKKKMDAAEERQELVASIVGSNLHTFKHNGRVFRK